MLTKTLIRLSSLGLAILTFLAIRGVAFAADDAPGTDAPPLSGMSDAALWAVFIGLAVPFITGVINRRTWTSEIKLVVFFAVTLVTTAVTVWLNGELDASNYFRTFLLILISASLTYQATKPAVHAVEERTG
jgi:hypothetical protein